MGYILLAQEKCPFCFAVVYETTQCILIPAWARIKTGSLGKESLCGVFAWHLNHWRSLVIATIILISTAGKKGSIQQNKPEIKALRKFRIVLMCQKLFLKGPNTAKSLLCETRTAANMLQKCIRKPSKKNGLGLQHQCDFAMFGLC